MTRRFEVGPILVALGAIVLLVSLFLDWYGPLSAWEAFEVVEVLLAALAVAALIVAAGQLVPDLELGRAPVAAGDRRSPSPCSWPPSSSTRRPPPAPRSSSRARGWRSRPRW